MLTKKHFNRIAELLRCADTSGTGMDHYSLCVEMGKMCVDENPNFSMARFLKACTPDVLGPDYGLMWEMEEAAATGDMAKVASLSSILEAQMAAAGTFTRAGINGYALVDGEA